MGIWSVLGFVYLLLLFRGLRPARRTIQRGQRAHHARTEHRIGTKCRLRFSISVEYDALTGQISGGFGLPRSWCNRAVAVVMWLASQRLLPTVGPVWNAARLG